MNVVLAQGDFFREFFRSLFSANLFVTGIVLTIGAVLLFYGSIYLFNLTNLGKRLGFLVTGAALFGWLTITSMLFVVYALAAPSRTTSKAWARWRSGSSRSPICWSAWCCSWCSWSRSTSTKSSRRNRALLNARSLRVDRSGSCGRPASV